MIDPASRPHPDAGPQGAPAERVGLSAYLLAMSHELRAPLNAIIGMSGLLLEGDLESRERQYVRSIHAAGEGLSTVLNDVLDLSRIAADDLTIEPIGFDLRSLVDETARALTPRAEQRGLALNVDWRPELPRQVIGDPGRTRQVLGNLVGHAINAMSQGEVVIRVAADGETGGVPLVRFTVEDTGIGLPPERLARVFEEYVPVDTSPYRSFGVTGLGLRISAELVRLMGGDIGATSEVGKGSRFWFRLPMAPAESPLLPRLDRAPASTGGRILFVESDPASRARLGPELAEHGWQVDFVDDPGVVPERLRAAHEDCGYRACVLSDYAVRPLHAEIAARIKADAALGPVALIMITAVGSPGDAKRLWHAGFAAYLRKPVPGEEFRDTLLALGQLGVEGRGPSLITRHSLAEARSAETSRLEGIDEVLAELTGPQPTSTGDGGAPGLDQLPDAPAEPIALAGISPPAEAEAAPEVEPVQSGGPELAPPDLAVDTTPIGDLDLTGEPGDLAPVTDPGLLPVPAEALRPHSDIEPPADLLRIEDIIDDPVEAADGFVANDPSQLFDPSESEAVPVVDSVAPPSEPEPPASVDSQAADRPADAGPIALLTGGPPPVEPTETPPEQPAETQPVVGPTVLEQLASGGSSFSHHLVGSFLREGPERIAELATAASRNDLGQLTRAIQALKTMSGLLGASQLVARCAGVERHLEAEDVEAAAGQIGEIEHAFLEVRAAIEAVTPPGAAVPTELPPVNAAFLDQLRPERDGPARALALRLVQSFRAETSGRIDDLRDAIASEDAPVVQRLAQALKGMCSLVGAEPLAKLCALVEADARLQRVANARRYADQLLLESRRALAAFDQAGA
jgi:HPt (histidine-containing phosphotransfer) domain-containing protein